MTNQKEAAEQLNNLTTLLASIAAGITKIGGETSTLLQKLIDMGNAAGDAVSPELQAALDAATAQGQVVADAVKNVDDLVPDAAPAGDGSATDGGNAAAQG